jgi:hypothetical protein
MLSVKAETRVNVKFLAKLGKSATETYILLMEVYGDDCLFHTQVLERFKRVKDGKGDIEDDPCPGRPCTSKTDANIEKVDKTLRKNRCLSIQAVAELADINKETVRQILHEHLLQEKSVLLHGAENPHS